MWKEQHAANISRRWKHLPDATVDRAETLANECRSRLINAVEAVAKECQDNPKQNHRKLPQRTLGILLSGGVDSTAILEACQVANISLHDAVTVSIVDDQEAGDNNNTDNRRMIPQDEKYAIEAVRIYNQAMQAKNKKQPKMGHSVLTLSPSELVQRYSHPTIQTLAVWGYMETRNSLIMSAALDECRNLGLTDVLTGDNADELLGGSYDWYFKDSYANDKEGWIQKRNDTANLPFVTNKLATTFGIRLHQPFRESNLLDWAIRETGRSDCIDINKTCRLQSEFDGPFTPIYNCGKLPLREAFRTVASWRTMDWIFRGSGAAGPNENDDQNVPPLVAYYQNLYTDTEFEEEQAYYRIKHNIVLQSKEHLHNIRIFLENFGGFDQHPTKQRYPVGDPRGCVSCLYDIGDEQFCHLCDEYPAQHPKKTQEE